MLEDERTLALCFPKRGFCFILLISAAAESDEVFSADSSCSVSFLIQSVSIYFIAFDLLKIGIRFNLECEI